jgi:DNA-directed RNA polymerase beta subunit
MTLTPIERPHSMSLNNMLSSPDVDHKGPSKLLLKNGLKSNTKQTKTITMLQRVLSHSVQPTAPSALNNDIELDDEGELARSFMERTLTRDQIDSYNDLMDVQIPNIISQRVIRLDAETHVAFTEPRYVLPYITDQNGTQRVLYPRTARRERRTYDTILKVTMEHRRNDTGELVAHPDGRSVIRNMEVCRIPVMIGSNKDNLAVHHIYEDTEKLLQKGECPYDPRGYFIVKGVEKIILIQENLRAMRIMIIKKKDEHICQITCRTIKGSVIVRLSQDKHTHSINIYLRSFMGSKDESIPIFQVYRILGITDMDEIVDSILQFVPESRKGKIRMCLQNTIRKTSMIEDDFTSVYLNSIYIPGKKDNHTPLKGSAMERKVYDTVRGDLFPHIGIEEPQSDKEFDQISNAKLRLLSIMVARYTEFLSGLRKIDNRDSWSNKRLILGGPKIQQLFRTLWDKMLDNVDSKMPLADKDRTMENVKRYIKPSIITKDLSTSLSSNQWGASGRSKSANVTEAVDRGESVLAFPDQILRISAPVNRQGLQMEARSVQGDQHGYIDAVATPSSLACGLVKNKAVGCEVSIQRSDILVKLYLESDKLVHPKSSADHPDICIVNANPIGWCNGRISRDRLLRRRRNNEIYHDTALIHLKKDSEFHIYTDGERPIKPFIIMDDNVPRNWGTNVNSFDKLCEMGVIEWLDIMEAMNHCAVAQSMRLVRLIKGETESALMRRMMMERRLSSMDKTTSGYSDLVREIEHLTLQLNRLSKKIYTHVDIDPNLAFGSSSGVIPWSENNQSPRNSFQCLHEDELVLMANGDRKPIKELKNGDSVISIDPNTYEISKTKIHSYFRVKANDNGKQIYQLVSLDGKIIRATGDHRFLTSKGWVELQNLNIETDLLAIYSNNTLPISTVGSISHIPIRSIEMIEDTWVCDFTTESDNHSFVAGEGFITHNCSMGRQAMGLNHSNCELNFPTTGKYLVYPTPPIAATQMQKMIGLDALPAGRNVIIAVMTTSTNEEDAITIKKEFLERCALDYVVVHCYDTLIKGPTKISNGDIVEKLVVPDDSFPRSKFSYRHIGENGIARIGSVIEPGDCLISKVKIVKKTSKGLRNKVKYRKVDASTYANIWEHGVVDDVRISHNELMERIVEIKIAICGRPTDGDKAASRQAQKSTMRIDRSEKDLPYTKSGMTPDIIINPHAIPKRMTIAMFIEIIACKLAALLGIRVNATSFKDIKVDDFCEMLKVLFGYSESGEETLYHFTGKDMITCKLMIGPIYYQLLKHQVGAKYQFRGEGNRSLLTRLPNAGRDKGGGVRFSEQECGAVLAHGSPHFLKNRTLDACDLHQAVVCRSCNHFAIVDLTQDAIICRVCGGTRFGVSEQAYTQTLLTRYCAAGGVRMLPIYALKDRKRRQLEKPNVDSTGELLSDEDDMNSDEDLFGDDMEDDDDDDMNSEEEFDDESYFGE